GGQPLKLTLFLSARSGLRLQARRVHSNHAIGVLLAWLSLRVGESPRHERLRRGVAVLQVLKDGATERILILLGKVREELAVALDNETGQTTFEIGFGIPTYFIAADTHVRWRGRGSVVGNGGVLDVLHPGPRDRFTRQPGGLQGISVK